MLKKLTNNLEENIKL